MRRVIPFLLLLAGQAIAPACAQQVVDRIVARVEDDILMLSEMRELGRYQQLTGGAATSDDRLLRQLLEQWIVNTEAAAAGFPQPVEADADKEFERLEATFASREAFLRRLQELELSAAAVRRLVARQLYLARYLDYKFRPAVQVDAGAIEIYYREELVPPLAARGQPAPALEKVQDKIRELLIQRGITERAARWLDETRARLKIEMRNDGP